MKYEKLGNTGIEVSKLCVGCMSFGRAGTMHDWTLDEERSESMTAWNSRIRSLWSALQSLPTDMAVKCPRSPLHGNGGRE